MDEQILFEPLQLKHFCAFIYSMAFVFCRKQDLDKLKLYNYIFMSVCFLYDHTLIPFLYLGYALSDLIALILRKNNKPSTPDNYLHEVLTVSATYLVTVGKNYWIDYFTYYVIRDYLFTDLCLYVYKNKKSSVTVILYVLMFVTFRLASQANILFHCVDVLFSKAHVGKLLVLPTTVVIFLFGLYCLQWYWFIKLIIPKFWSILTSLPYISKSKHTLEVQQKKRTD